MKNILVPCDFSSASLNALKFALDVAALSGSTVHVLNVIETTLMPNSAVTPMRPFGTSIRRDMTGKARAYYEQMMRGQNPDRISTHFSVKFGTPSKAILGYAQKSGIDLIVMGSHGVSVLRDFFVGSNTEKIVRTAHVPVIVVKNFYKGPLENIVVPLSADQESYPDFFLRIKALQKLFRSRLHLLWVNTPANFKADEVTRQWIESVARKFKFGNYTINIYNQLYEEEGILRFAALIDADMIAMGTHGRKGIAHMMYGSKTEDVANHGKALIWTLVMK